MTTTGSTTRTRSTDPVSPQPIPPIPAHLDAARRRLKLATVRRTAAEVLLTAKSSATVAVATLVVNALAAVGPHARRRARPRTASVGIQLGGTSELMSVCETLYATT